MSVLDTLANASPARRSETLCVDSALQAEHDAARDRLEDAAEADQRNSLADLPAVNGVIDELDAIRERMKASEVRFDFERMPWTARIQLQADHPPREGDVRDQMRGFNVATYYAALVRGSCVAVTGADGDTVTEVPEQTWDGLLGTDEKPGSLNYKQVETLIGAATAVNDGLTSVPPSARSWLKIPDSGASLAQPSPGADLPPSGSEGGSRPTSPKSSTTKKARTKARPSAT